MSNKIVIIGAGPAGVSAVEALREHDQHSEVVMLSAEPYPPYSPPAMIDHFLSGSEAHYWRGQDWAERMQVDYRKGATARGIDLKQKTVFVEGGLSIPYDRLVIASGSRLYAPLPGVDLPGVDNFKSLSAAEKLIGKVRRGEAKSALIVGAGFIGMEIALLLCDLGVQVTQIEMLKQVMPAMLDEQTAAYALKAMRERGVNLRLGTKGRAFVGNGKVSGVQLESGETLRADIFIAATGVRPNLDFLEGSGIAHRWGLSVDQKLHAYGPDGKVLTDVYAAGDAIEAPDWLSGETYVHANFPNATEQGRLVGLSLAGFDETYEGAERMNSLKHLGLPIMAVGMKQGDERLSKKMNGGIRTLYLKDNRLVGYQLVGNIQASGALHTLLRKREDVSKFKDRLLEESFGQGTLAWDAMSE